jgi:hypothetical protein
MHALLLTVFCMSTQVVATEADGLVGVWKLVSWQVIVGDGPPQNEFGLHPKGYLILTREGRAMVLTTAERRKPGMGDAERAELHKSMLAYAADPARWDSWPPEQAFLE